MTMSKERLEEAKSLPEILDLEGCHDAAELAKELLAELEEAQRSLAMAQGVNRDFCNAAGKAKSALADLQKRHSTLIHMLNDCCMFANELDASTDCGRKE